MSPFRLRATPPRGAHDFGVRPVQVSGAHLRSLRQHAPCRVICKSLLCSSAFTCPRWFSSPLCELHPIFGICSIFSSPLLLSVHIAHSTHPNSRSVTMGSTLAQMQQDLTLIDTDSSRDARETLDRLEDIARDRFDHFYQKIWYARSSPRQSESDRSFVSL